jgi:hypothetical protein
MLKMHSRKMRSALFFWSFSSMKDLFLQAEGDMFQPHRAMFRQHILILITMTYFKTTTDKVRTVQ